MLRLASDENFKGEIVRGLRRRLPGLDLVRIQDAGLSGMEDPDILAWAAAEGRVLLTHDRSTIPDFAYERVRGTLPMPGVFAVKFTARTGQVIEELVLAILCGFEDEWKNTVTYFPL